jgi:hypothetical protein
MSKYNWTLSKYFSIGHCPIPSLSDIRWFRPIQSTINFIYKPTICTINTISIRDDYSILPISADDGRFSNYYSGGNGTEPHNQGSETPPPLPPKNL